MGDAGRGNGGGFLAITQSVNIPELGQWEGDDHQGLQSPRWGWGCWHSTMIDSGWPSQGNHQDAAGDRANDKDGGVDNGHAGDDRSLPGTFVYKRGGPCAVPPLLQGN